MRQVGRFILAPIIVGFAFLFVLGLLTIASRDYATIWLPLTLAAIVGLLLQIAPAPKSMSQPLWLAIASGVIVLWMLSEPEVSFNEHHELRYVAMALMAVCATCALVVAVRTFTKVGMRHAYAWGLALVLMSWLIAYFSSPSGGSGGMIAWAERLFAMSPDQAQSFIHIVRKTIHFCFYGSLGLTGFMWAKWCGAERRHSIAMGLCTVAAFASFDECRQTFFPNRTGSFWDVLLDLSGAVVFVGIAAATFNQSVSVKPNAD